MLCWFFSDLTLIRAQGSTVVSLGPPSFFYSFDCALQIANSPDLDREIWCVTQPGFGQNNVFRVVVGDQQATSTDTYSYAVGPLVYSVRGCVDVPTSNATTNCPTDGLTNGQATTLTIKVRSVEFLVCFWPYSVV